jgi:hypothetical protein
MTATVPDVAGIPDGLVEGGPATSRAVVLSVPPDAVLRPRLGWRLLFAFLAVPIPFRGIAQIADGTWEWQSLFFSVPVLLFATAAWRKRVVLRGDELHQQGTLTRHPVLRAAEIAAVTAHREKGDLHHPGTRAVVLRLWLANGTYRGYVRFWWGNWEMLARWVAAHHTKPSSDGVPRWTVPTDGETMRRLAPVLEGTRAISSGARP